MLDGVFLLLYKTPTNLIKAISFFPVLEIFTVAFHESIHIVWLHRQKQFPITMVWNTWPLHYLYLHWLDCIEYVLYVITILYLLDGRYKRIVWCQGMPRTPNIPVKNYLAIETSRYMQSSPSPLVLWCSNWHSWFIYRWKPVCSVWGGWSLLWKFVDCLQPGCTPSIGPSITPPLIPPHNYPYIG